jgi:hypothetical protein
VNAEPVMLIAVTTRLAVPVLVITTVFVLLLPTVALPKDNEFGEIVAETVVPPPPPPPPDPGSVGAATPVLPQPVKMGNASRTAMAQACVAFVAIDLGFVKVPLTLTFACVLTGNTASTALAPTVRRGAWRFNLNGPAKRYERRNEGPVLPATGFTRWLNRASRPMPERMSQD